MVNKKYQCELRKRRVVTAKSWLDAKEKFQNFCENNELPTRIKLKVKD
jgi:hypothetical protein